MANKKHIRFDWAIKRLLRHKANFTILEGFLSELLMFDVKIQEIIESEGNQEHEKDKYNKVDILVKDTDDNHMLIEVQNEKEDDYFQRMFYGQAKLVAERLNIGDEYGKLTRVYSINVVYFPLGSGKDYVYISDGNFRGLHNNDVLELTNKQKKLYKANQVKDLFTQYYIIKVNQFDDIAKNSLDEWIYFLKNSEIKDEFKAKGLEEAKERLRVDNLPPAEKTAYNNYVKAERIRNAEIHSAYTDGKLENQKELDEKQQELEHKQKELEAEKQRVETEKQRAETEKQRAETEKQRAETEKQRAETERQEKEQKQKELEAEKQKANELKQKMILKLHKMGDTIEEIAEEMQMSVAEIKKIVEE